MKGPLWGFSPAQKRQTEMKALEKRLPLCSRGPSSVKPPCLPTVPSSLPPPPPAGRCHTVKEHVWVAGQKDLSSNPIPAAYPVSGLSKLLGLLTPDFFVKGHNNPFF